MKTIYLLSLMLVLLLPRGTRAQGETRTAAPPEFSNCFPRGFVQRSGSNDQTAGKPQSGLSSYGGSVTPRGTLKVLVIFAGFTNDVNRQAPDYAQNLNNTNPWPQTDATHPVPGTSFPQNANADFYDNPSSFQNNAVDKSLSNLYYQMSRHCANPFKLQAVFFPKRINVTADDVKNARGGGMIDYTDEVMTALINDPDTQNFDFSQVDQRGASPNFQYDNSSSAPDHVIDYMVIVWRNPGTPYQTVVPQNGIAYGGAGWAGVPQVTGIPSANGQVYRTQYDMGFTQAAGMNGLDQAVFVHEFAHNVSNAPHYLGANRTVGENFYISEGPGLMGNFRMYFMANAWERWYNGWVELMTGTTHVDSDIQGPASLTATNGEFTLRDYISTGDVMRIRLPNSSQYLWLENHQYTSGFDGRTIFQSGSRTPPNPLRGAPVGIVAMVEGIADSRSTILVPDLMGCNGLKVVSAQGNFDYTRGANRGSYNN